MYDERERFSIKDVVLQVVLVVLFVFLLLWLFPTKSYVDNKIDSKLAPLYNQIFTTNINNMKEAAVSYFTTSRLPKNIGDKEKLTLGEMLDKKLLISFLDSNNKKCSLTDSYVEITKMDDEYILKVNLSCSDNSDYILVHLGCYNYCQSGLCEKQETTVSTKTSTTVKKTNVIPLVNKNYEYEYEKVINGKWGDWSEWSEWSTSRVDKTEYRNVRTKQELVVVGKETIKVGTKTVITDAKATTTHYCPSGYTQNGTTCTRSYQSTDVVNATVNRNTTYSCDSGYTLSGTNCVKTISTSYTDRKNATATTNYGSWYKVSRKEYTSKKVSSATVRYDFISSRTAIDCNNSCRTVTYYTYDMYRRSTSQSYNCNAYPGYTLSGSSCVKTSTSSYVDTRAAHANTSTSYSCPAGYTLSGDKCSKQITNTQNIKASSKTTYSCKKGDLVGRSCVTYEDKYETFDVYATTTYYSYQERQYISGERKVVWSRSQSDQTLIRDGYSLTGNYREI